MSVLLGLRGELPEPLRTALRERGYEFRPPGTEDDVVLVADRSDPNDLSRQAVNIAICSSVEACVAAYRAGAYFAVPADAEALFAAIERARTIAADRRAAERLRGSTLATLEREAILSAMKAAAGSTARAAAMLDISVRKVQYKLHEYGFPLARRGGSAPKSDRQKAANDS